jgi:ATP-binding cassette subfamily B protein
MFLNKMMWLLFPFVQLLMNFTTLLVIWVWAKYIESGVVEVWNMMAFLQYAMQVMMSFMFLTMLFIMIPRWAVSWKRISEVLNTKLSIKEWKEKIKNGVQSEIEFKNVSFSYWETSDLVLENISFVAKSGETTAIIGSTGSWKSTIVNLILRFYDATLGQVLVNGMDVRDYKKEDLMKKIWIVPQKSVLFSGSVKDNINFWTNNLSENEIKEFSKIAQASEFIEKLNWKYDFQIAQWWSNLSWWQKQRLSIARAIAKKSEIYIFDDSFSALDFKTDLALRQALKAITKNAVVLIVAQRIWTIKNADQIIVLDKGKIIWIWKHKELLKNCPIYKEIANSQLSEEELTVNNY